MTLLGKALVFFNLAFGLLLAGWAFSMHANGIDWTDRKDKNEPVGEFAGPSAESEQCRRIDAIGNHMAGVEADPGQLRPFLQPLSRDEDRRDRWMLAAEQIPWLALVHPGPVQRIHPAQIMNPRDHAGFCLPGD